jgi:hypothetical protein
VVESSIPRKKSRVNKIEPLTPFFLERRKYTRVQPTPSPIQSFIKPLPQGHKGLDPLTKNNSRYVNLIVET